MNLMSRILGFLLPITALLLTFSSLFADRLLEQWTITDQFGNHVALIDLQRKGERMSRGCQTTLERARCKDIAAESLCQGEMTLVEAAAFFRFLYEDPQEWHHPHRPRPDHEDGATWCHQVIEWTVMKVSLEQSPSQADAVRQRLERELQEQLADCGSVALPD